MMVILPLLAVAAVVAPSPNVMRVELRDARVEATAAGGSVAVSSLLINPTDSALVLVGITSPIAGQTVLQHYVKDKQGLVQVEMLDSLALPPRSETVLAPGALELQLVGVTQNLDAGLELPLTLKFADGTKRVVRVRVDATKEMHDE